MGCSTPPRSSRTGSSIYAFIHRPMGFRWGAESHPLDMWLSFSNDLQRWNGHRRLLRARRGEVDWEYLKVGLGAPPFRTNAGWLRR